MFQCTLEVRPGRINKKLELHYDYDAKGMILNYYSVSVRDERVRHELRLLMLRSVDRHFVVVREEALCLMCEEVRVVNIRPVEKAAPVGLSVVVCRMCWMWTLWCYGGVLPGVVVMYVYVGDVSVAGGGDTDVSSVDTVSCIDIDRVS